MSVRDGGGSVEDADGNVIANPRRCDLVGIETVKLLRALSDDAGVAIVEFGGNTNHWAGKIEPPLLTICEEPTGDHFILLEGGGRERLIDFVNTTISQLRYGTPTYSALEYTTERYPTADTVNVLTDGGATVCDTKVYDRSPGWKYDVAQAEILRDFAPWWAPFEANGCDLNGFNIGDNPNAADFLQNFCAKFNGTYIDR